MVFDISLHILDIAENSFKAGADRIAIFLKKTRHGIFFKIRDNGTGIDENTLTLARKGKLRGKGSGGNGLRLLFKACRGKLKIRSKSAGTTVLAWFSKTAPIGDLTETIKSLLLMSEEKNVHLTFKVRNKQEFVFDTNEIKEIFGPATFLQGEAYGILTGYINDGIRGIF